MTAYNTLEDALDLAKRYGFHVFPVHGAVDGDCACPGSSPTRDDTGRCTAPGKHPKVTGWQRAATRDPSRIEQWDWTNTNVGIQTNGLIVIDVDPRNGGDDSLEVIREIHQTEWVDTMMVRTGSGGTHLIYRGTARNGILADGVDIKATGGLIVGPGSHHVSGGRYEIVRDAPPEEAPSWLTRATRVKTQEDTGPDPMSLESVGEGGRDNYLTKVAGIFRKRGATESEILAILKVRNATVCEPPLPIEDLERIAHSIAQKPVDKNFIEQEMRVDRAIASAASRIKTVAEILNQPPPAYEIADVWPEGGVNVLFGDPGSLKSFVALDWAVSRATGEPWHGRKVKEPQRVLYVAAEGVYGMGARLYALLLRERWTEKVEYLDNLIVHAGAINVLSDEGRGALHEIIQERGIQLLILDTLRKSMTGGDENDVKDVGRLMTMLEDWHVTYDCSSLLIHHANKAGGFRGSSAILGDADNVWKVTRERGTLACKIKPEKFKDAPDDWELEVTFQEMQGISLASTAVELHDPNPQAPTIRHAENLPKEIRHPEDTTGMDGADIGAWYMVENQINQDKAAELVLDRHELDVRPEVIVRRYQALSGRRLGIMGAMVDDAPI